MSTTTAAQLIIEYPELAPLYAEDPAPVAAALARAERQTSADWDSTTRNDQVYLLAAHLLALSPMGRNARLSAPSSKDGVYVSTYQDELQRRKAANAFARSRIV